MDVEIVLHQNDFRGVGEVVVGQVLECMSVINGRSMLGQLHMPPAFERCEHHELR
jgi:hypothetical protein